MSEKSTLIVGAGIVGLSTAYALVRRGFAVTVVERGPIPNPLAASSDHHRLIRYSYADQPVYCRRIGEAFDAWRAMWSDLGGGENRYYAATGILTLSQRPGDWGDRARRTFDEVGIPYRRFTASHELEKAFPFLETANVAEGTLSEGGALMANRILADLADWLRAAGATLLEHSPAEAVDRRAGTIRLADGRVLGADRVVVTAGARTRDLVPELNDRLRPNRTVIVYADPPDDLAALYAAAPCWTDLGGDDDLWGAPPVNNLPAKLGCGALGRRDASDDDRVMRPDEVERMLAAYRGRFRGIDRFQVRFHQANYWTKAAEERFVIERDERLVAVSACSGHGFKFGALSGTDVASALDGSEPFETVRARMAGLAEPSPPHEVAVR